MITVNCAVDAANILGEAPIWHPGEGALYWVDAFKPSILRLSDDGTVDEWPMPELTASLVFRKGGGIVAGDAKRFSSCRPGSGQD